MKKNIKCNHHWSLNAKPKCMYCNAIWNNMSGKPERNMKKQTWEDSIVYANQIFYDETGIEISLAIDRALKKILTDHDRDKYEKNTTKSKK
ncbi:MAG: hypothetical protein AAB706_02445 [Patescibacteria group bacterium]